MDLNLAMILMPVPENSNDAQLTTLQLRQSRQPNARR
jgi:hypothetical protein